MERPFCLLPLLWAAVFLLGSQSASGQADSEAKVICAEAYERAQEGRAAGELKAAREQLRVCSREVCPAFVVADCARWLHETELALPTLVFSARRGDRELTEVKVLSDGEPLLESLSGKEVEIDPGLHTLSFEIPGSPPIVKTVSVEAGQKNRLLSIDFPVADEPKSRTVEHIETDPDKPPKAPKRRSLALPVTLGGIGVLGLGGFATFGALGSAREADLSDSCSPRCTDTEISPIRAQYLIADVFLGVGVVAIGATTVVLVGRRQRDDTARARWVIEARPNPGGATGMLRLEM